MTEQKLLGKWTSTSLVVGNMVGAGVFMMPALLAAFGGISIIGWLVSSTGAILIAILFSRLSKMLPGIQGGPYAFTRKGMGEFPAFLVAWGYWVSVWTTNAALAVAIVSYLNILFPVIGTHFIYSSGTALLIIWGLTWFNTLKVEKVGKMSLITTVLKLAPILIICIWGLFFIDFSYFVPFNISGESNWMAIGAVTTLTFFSFLGIESATIPAEKVENPEKTVSFATKYGTLIAAGVYILSSVSIMGIIPPIELADSSAPFADAAEILWGSNAQYFVAIAASISIFGALNGWILIQGQMPEAISRDKLFPGIFAKLNKNGAPALGIIISSFLASILILMNYSGSLLEVFEFMVLVSTVSVLIPYIFCSISYFILVKLGKTTNERNNYFIILTVLTLIFSIYALIGSGYKSVIWGLVFLLLGVPFYILLKRKQTNDH